MKGQKINLELKDFQEVFYSEKHQTFYVQGAFKSKVSKSSKLLWVFEKPRSDEFMNFVKPIIKKEHFVSFVYCAMLLEVYLENIHEAEKF